MGTNYNIMKTLIITAMTALAITATGFAGSSKDAIAPTEPLSQWFVGGTVEYADRAETEVYTLKAGKRYFQTDKISWSLFGEIGYGTKSFRFADVDMMPFTFNGEVRYNLTEKWSVYAGAGLGTCYLDVNTDTDWYITYQMFSGVAYQLGSNLELNVGARYTWISDVDVVGTVDSVSYGAGVTWYF
jgi:opacity protein-like surface antigen